MQGLPSLVQICLVWFLPESPRWLVSKGREEQALQTLAYYHADGNVYVHGFSLDIFYHVTSSTETTHWSSTSSTRSRQPLNLTGTVGASGASRKLYPNISLYIVAANVGWKALFSTPGNRKRMRIIIAIAFFSQWSGNGIASYYLNQVRTSLGFLGYHIS